MIPRTFILSRASLVGVGVALGLLLSACGLGRDSGTAGEGIRDPIVAATVNGRAIYREDVLQHAVARGMLQEGQDVDGTSQAFHDALEELIQIRLFAMEAEARGLDRQSDIQRQIDNARERVLAAAIYEEIDQRASDPEVAERLYRQYQDRLGQGTEAHIRLIHFGSREAADVAKRRIAEGERFEMIAFEQNTNGDGGDVGWRALSDLAPPVRAAVDGAANGELVGPLQVNDTWLLIRVEDRRERGGPSLEELRPRIMTWLRFKEVMELHERLERDARIERMGEAQIALDPGEDTPVPADAEPQQPARPAPSVVLPPGQAPPPFPFPLGPSAPPPASPEPQQPSQPATASDQPGPS